MSQLEEVDRPIHDSDVGDIQCTLHPLWRRMWSLGVMSVSLIFLWDHACCFQELEVPTVRVGQLDGHLHELVDRSLNTHPDRRVHHNFYPVPAALIRVVALQIYGQIEVHDVDQTGSSNLLGGIEDETGTRSPAYEFLFAFVCVIFHEKRQHAGTEQHTLHKHTEKTGHHTASGLGNIKHVRAVTF